MDEVSDWIVLAHLLRPQGRKGELLADLLTDFPERFETGCPVFLAGKNFHGGRDQARPAQVTGYWLPMGKNQGRIVLKLAGIDSISAAEDLAALDVLVPLKERLPLHEGENYISDLIGCTVYDGTLAVGTIQEVQFATTADGARRLEDAAPMLVLTSQNSEEILVPFAKDFLVRVDTEGRRVDMILPAGLLDVNR